MKFFAKLFILLLLSNTLYGVSLWMKSSNNQRGLYGDKRSFAVGDLITIDVGESSSLAASQNSVRNRQSQIENAVKQFLFANSGMGKHKGDLPATEIETKSSNQGGKFFFDHHAQFLVCDALVPRAAASIFLGFLHFLQGSRQVIGD